jgi:hypothetical protein
VERDHKLEGELLELAAAERPGYREEVTARLDHFEEDNGGNLQGWDADVDQILAEAQEEAADVSGWLVGAAAKLEPAQVHQLLLAMRFASWAHRELQGLREELAAQ